MVFYENLVITPDVFAGHLKRFCVVNEEITVPQDSSKKHRGDTKTYAEFCQEILSYEPRKVLGDGIFSLITNRLDQETLAKTPYIKYLDD